jgi:hypothetical protein
MNMPRIPDGREAAQRAEEDHRHRRVDPTTQHQRFQHVVHHARDHEQHGVETAGPVA